MRGGERCQYGRSSSFELLLVWIMLLCFPVRSGRVLHGVVEAGEVR